jgi:hypothetical protein
VINCIADKSLEGSVWIMVKKKCLLTNIIKVKISDMQSKMIKYAKKQESRMRTGEINTLLRSDIHDRISKDIKRLITIAA